MVSCKSGTQTRIGFTFEGVGEQRIAWAQRFGRD